MRRGRTARLAAAAVGVLILLGALAYRAFAPQETLIRPTAAYPDAAPIVDERPFSELRAAPLLVDGRLRVYAEKYRVWADGPVGERYETTPYWSYRRWPAEVLALATAVTSAGNLAVSHWSDGQLIAIDTRSGEIAWRLTVPVEARGYDGRRTGASTVYAPASLLTTASGNGDPIVVVLSTGAVSTVDAATGRQLWQHTLPTDCTARAWTTRNLVALPACGDGSGVSLVDATSGREVGTFAPLPSGATPAPAGCRLGRSQCRLVNAGGDTWLAEADGRLTPVPAFGPDALLAGDLVIYPTTVGVSARPITSPTPQWTWTGQGRPIAADGAGVYLLTPDLTMIGLNPYTGGLRTVGCAAMLPDEKWHLGHVYSAGDGQYVALERVTNAVAEAEDREYFYAARPVALVEMYPPDKLPVWPGKFAACRPF